MKNYALITGASQGIGSAFAEYLAAREKDLLLVALDEPALYQAERNLRDTYGIACHSLGIDLTEEGAARRVWEWTREHGFSVDTLIPNAGFGRNGIFERTELAEYLAMMKLNNQAVVELTYHFLPQLKEQPQAHLLYMSSMESALPLPYKAVYAATKNFVYNFALSLREEVKEAGVNVTVVCPGPVITNEDGLKRIQTQGAKARLLVLFPEQVAREAIRGMLRGKQIVVPGRTAKVLTFLGRTVPAPYKMPLLERMFRAYREE